MALFNIKKDASFESELRLEEIPIKLIIPNPDQPRRAFDEESIAELAASIKQVGLLQPLLVRRSGGFYELIAGERRLRAVKLLGQKTVRCIIGSATEEDSALMAAIENLQREDLHFFEEAECYLRLLDRLRVTQEELAKRLGKSQGFIANKLRLLKLTPELRQAVIEAGVSERQARSLLRLGSDEERITAVRKIAAKGLSVNEAEKLIDRMLQDSPASAAARRPKMIRIFRDYKLFINTINTACDQLRESGLKVEVSENTTADGVDISVRVSR